MLLHRSGIRREAKLSETDSEMLLVRMENKEQNCLAKSLNIMKSQVIGIAGRPTLLGKFAGGCRRSKFALVNEVICSRVRGRSPRELQANLSKIAM